MVREAIKASLPSEELEGLAVHPDPALGRQAAAAPALAEPIPGSSGLGCWVNVATPSSAPYTGNVHTASVPVWKRPAVAAPGSRTFIGSGASLAPPAATRFHP